MTAYIGGNLTFDERMRRYGPKLRALPVQGADNWKLQCYCGKVGFVRYLGRRYCPQCGRRLPTAWGTGQTT